MIIGMEHEWILWALLAIPGVPIVLLLIGGLWDSRSPEAWRRAEERMHRDREAIRRLDSERRARRR
jgi:hypothetical protein